jgi:hypothetical protein
MIRSEPTYHPQVPAMSDEGEVELSIPEPCGASWEQMSGQGARRHCSSCDKDVHHLSMMRREDAHALLTSHKNKSLCVRYFVGADGDILFADDEPVAHEPAGRLRAQLSGARKLLAAAMVAAPLLLAACEQPGEPAPAAQAPLIIKEGQPVKVDPGAATPPAFKPTPPAEPAPPAPAIHEVDGGLAMPAELEGDVKQAAEPAPVEGCEGGAEAAEAPKPTKKLPKYKHKKALSRHLLETEALMGDASY